MADTPATPGETAPASAVSQTPVTPPAPANSSASSDEADRLRKEAEQARMRANQLQNELDKRAKAETEAEQKRLEETQQYKELYDKTQAELRAIQDKADAEQRQAELNTAAAEITKEYPDAVQSIAKSVGLTLSDDSEAGKALFKSKLDELSKTVTPAQISSSNNPSETPSVPSSGEPVAPEFAPVTEGAWSRGSQRPVTQMALAGASGDDSIARKYVSGLKTIEQMRKDSGFTRSET